MHDRLTVLGKLVDSVEHWRWRAALMADDASLYKLRLRSCFERVPWRFGHPTSSRATTLVRWASGLYLTTQHTKHPFRAVRDKTGPCKSSAYIVRRHSQRESLAECTEKLQLADVTYVTTHQVFYLATVCLFQRSEAPDIKRLEQMRGMWRHAQRHDVVPLAVELELHGVVALVAVEDQQPVCAYLPRVRVAVEVLDPFHPSLVRGPAILSSCEHLVARKVALRVPVCQVILALEDDERWDRPASCIHALDYCSPLSVAGLCQAGSRMSAGAGHDHRRRDDSHHEPGFVEIVDVIVNDSVPCPRSLNQAKPLTNHLWIFAFIPPVIVFARKARPQLWSAPYEIRRPVLPDTRRVACRQHPVRHIFYTTQPRRGNRADMSSTYRTMVSSSESVRLRELAARSLRARLPARRRRTVRSATSSVRAVALTLSC